MHKPINIAECLNFLGMDPNKSNTPSATQSTTIKNRISFGELLRVYKELTKDYEGVRKPADIIAALRLLDTNGSGSVPIARLSELITTEDGKFTMTELLTGEIDSQGCVNYEQLLQQLAEKSN